IRLQEGSVLRHHGLRRARGCLLLGLPSVSPMRCWLRLEPRWYHLRPSRLHRIYYYPLSRLPASRFLLPRSGLERGDFVLLTPSRHSDRGVPPHLFFVWFSEDRPIGRKQRSCSQNRDRKFFSDAAISTKPGLLETLQHMVVRRLR